MKKIRRLPHEQVSGDQDDGLGAARDGLPAADDTEGHRYSGFEPAPLAPGMPGTGGDNLHRPVGSGEIDDVEGHAMGHTKGERLSPGMPGTGGDARADHDAEGDRAS